MRSRAIKLSCALVLLIAATPAFARPTPDDYRAVGVTLPSGAHVPMQAVVTDETGAHRALQDMISRPTVLVFSDFTCRTLCGPAVAFVAEALRQSGLKAGAQFGLLVIGLDPRDSAQAAANQRRDHLGDDAALNAATHFVTADTNTVQSLTDALGYRYRYDASDDQYLHPAAVYVLGKDGAVSRVLTSIGLSGDDLRLALVEVGDGRIGTTADRIRLLCSHFDPAQGTYNLMVSWLMAGTGVATIAILVLLLGGLMLSGRCQPLRGPPG